MSLGLLLPETRRKVSAFSRDLLQTIVLHWNHLQLERALFGNFSLT
jgi:hypothetical protein